MTSSSLPSNTVRRRALRWVACLPFSGNLVGCSPQEYAAQKQQEFKFVSASLDLADQRITEKTRLSRFDGSTQDINALKVAIGDHDKDGTNRILAKYGAYASGRYRPAELASLVTANDILPGPASLSSNRSAASHPGFLYGVQLIGKGSGGTGSTTRMNYLEPFWYVTYSYDLPNDNGYLFGGPGPYVALGLWGRIKSGFYSTNTYSRFDGGGV